MHKTSRSAVDTPVIKATPVVLALAAMLVLCSPANAASIGHSRLLSKPGQPLRIDVPVRQLSQADIQSLRVRAAPASAWQQAGLVPPVDLSTLQVKVAEGFAPQSRVIQIRSSQPFNGPVADLLLQVDTAAGSQQHQVSLLAYESGAGTAAATQPGASPSGQGSTAGAQASGASPSAPSSISVRRGDTLFALATANAVEGVTVYQMMVALQRANPQAFIDGNLNLVKAGAKLSIPDASALRAVSDREARRIFQQHVQAYAAYRQGIAAKRGAAVQGGSAQKGALSNGSGQASAAPGPAHGDRVLLSSGAAPESARDEQDATQQNISESQSRVSQLERNVHSLNQALQMQGEAAKDAVLEGAAAVSQTLSDATNGVGGSPESSTASPAAQAAGSSAQAGTASTGASDAGTAQGAGNAPAGSATGETSSNAQAGSSSPQAPSGQASANGGSNDGAGATQDNTTTTSNQAGQPVSWLQENLLGVITAVLALIVLIIAWVLRRASASRSDDGQVTEAMVQERLDKIDFDFDKQPADGRPPHTS